MAARSSDQLSRRGTAAGAVGSYFGAVAATEAGPSAAVVEGSIAAETATRVEAGERAMVAAGDLALVQFACRTGWRKAASADVATLVSSAAASALPLAAVVEASAIADSSFATDTVALRFSPVGGRAHCSGSSVRLPNSVA